MAVFILPKVMWIPIEFCNEFCFHISLLVEVDHTTMMPD